MKKCANYSYLNTIFSLDGMINELKALLELMEIPARNTPQFSGKIKRSINRKYDDELLPNGHCKGKTNFF
ncbi:MULTISPECIES: hypothetical protein [Sphingobacterium]|uniref:hypothetical protein n=1 Tax=Sphingobacterium TaxID=28453 RepID=UPI00104F7EF3|nr:MULTISPECIES: hypothetical protein [Sphingobacterium]MCW2259742.1 hypothetical protein [Sphingobacterium kitahiroshimense]TCR03418.1 hypothetical protein EDF67_11277 [Sphingobacterium sp. JUb78]